MLGGQRAEAGRDAVVRLDVVGQRLDDAAGRGDRRAAASALSSTPAPCRATATTSASVTGPSPTVRVMRLAMRRPPLASLAARGYASGVDPRMPWWSCPNPGEPERAARCERRPRPGAGPGEVLVKVAATAVNRADLHAAAGQLPAAARARRPTSGWSAPGTIAALGEAVAGWNVGDEVCALLSGGGYAELVAVPVGPADARAARRLAGRRGGAARGRRARCGRWCSAATPAGCSPARRFLVHGGTSGIGTMAIQLAHTTGRARVHHRRHAAQGRRLPRPRRRRRDQLPRGGLRRARSSPRPARPVSTSSSTTWGRPTSPATCRRWPSAGG